MQRNYNIDLLLKNQGKRGGDELEFCRNQRKWLEFAKTVKGFSIMDLNGTPTVVKTLKTYMNIANTKKSLK